MLKYLAVLAVIFGLTVYVSIQDERAAQQAAQKAAEFHKSAIPAKPNENPAQENTENTERNLPGWYSFFRWPNGTTTWAILLTLMAIAEQTGETRKAAKAALLNVQALVNAERARIGFDVNEMGRSFQVDGKNTGKTSARIVYAHGFSVVLAHEETLPAIPIYKEAPDDISEWIGPGEKFDLHTAPDRYGLIADLTDMALCERIRDKKAVLWVFGCIRYFDGVSLDQREKCFCFATSVDQSMETYMYSAGPPEYGSET